MKKEAVKNIVSAIRQVLDGGIYLSGEMSAKLLHELTSPKTSNNMSPVNSLSGRELEILLLVGKGYKPHHIAQKLYLSTKTIEAH